MRETLALLGLVALLSQPVAALAEEDTTTVETTQSTSVNPIGEVVLFPVRLVTGVIGIPIGMVGGAFSGFVQGFNFPGGHTTTTTTTQTKTDD